MIAEYAQCQLRIEAIVYMTNDNNSVRQTVDMLHGDFCVSSLLLCEIDTSNAVFRNRDGNIRKVKLERRTIQQQ